jgi:plasmid segregation protein ParM
MEVLGIDIGFGFTKATNGRNVVVFKSVLGEATDIQFRDQVLDQSDQEQYLHVELDNQSYFVGELAERQSTVHSFTLDQNQLIATFAKTLALTGLGQLVERNLPVRVVTGLPIGYFRRHQEKLATLLQGSHPATFVDGDGKRRETVIKVNQVRVIPQPFGSLFNLVLNDFGEVSNRKILQEKVGIIDVGFRTCDYTIADRTRYSERGSRTTDAGISQAFSMITSKLRENSGVSVELYRLYQAVDSGSIKIRGKTYDIKAMADQVFGQLASAIATEAERLWARDWDMDAIVLAGGGGAVLAPHLRRLLQGEVLLVNSDKDPRLNNVFGYAKYAKHLWARAPAAQVAAG